MDPHNTTPTKPTAATAATAAIANFPTIILSQLAGWVSDDIHKEHDGEDFFNEFLIFFCEEIGMIEDSDESKLFSETVWEKGDEKIMDEFCEWFDDYVSLFISEFPRRDDPLVFRGLIETKTETLLRDYPVLARLQALFVVVLHDINVTDVPI